MSLERGPLPVPKTHSGKEAGQADIVPLGQAGRGPLEQSPQCLGVLVHRCWPTSSSVLCANCFLTAFLQMRRELSWER